MNKDFRTKDGCSTEFFHLTGSELWGDYGNVLISGIISGERDDECHLQRSGPFIPPITLPGIFSLLITEKLIEEIKNLCRCKPNFKEVIIDRFVDIPWHTWDRTLDEPPMIPRGGEPENYVLKIGKIKTLPHPDSKIYSVRNLCMVRSQTEFEMVAYSEAQNNYLRNRKLRDKSKLPNIGDYNRITLDLERWDSSDLFSTSNGQYVVTKTGRKRLGALGGEWLSFNDSIFIK